MPHVFGETGRTAAVSFAIETIESPAFNPNLTTQSLLLLASNMSPS